MSKDEAIEIAKAFWLQRKETPLVKTTAYFREDENEWNVIFRINPKDDEDIVAIIVNVETKKAQIFGLL
jgi:hypothetical protein